MTKISPTSYFSFLCLLLMTLTPLITSETLLQFNAQGEFTILQFSDLHYFGNAEPEKDAQTLELQIKLIQEVKPDLVIVTGDAIQIPESKIDEEFEELWKKFTKPMIDANIPYAYLLGNHDAEEIPNRIKIAKLDQTNPLSVRGSCEGIPDTTNFILPIYSSRNSSQLAANFWMFDSGSVGCDGFISSWGCIEQKQLDWYSKESDKLRKRHGENIHHLAFFHIPLPEVVNMYNDDQFYGERLEGISCPYINTGFFDLVKEKGEITGIFTGHDHTNSFGGWYRDVELVYGIKSGYNTYGDKRGCRVIKLQENFNEQGELNVTRSHYALYEDGSIELPGNLKRREGPKLEGCKYPGTYSKWHVALNKWLYDMKKWILAPRSDQYIIASLLILIF